MRKLALVSLLAIVWCGAALAAPAQLSVKSILYNGATINGPMQLTVHPGDEFTIAVQGPPGSKFDAVSYLVPVKTMADAASATTGTLIGKPVVFTLGTKGNFALKWHVGPKSKVGIHLVYLVAPPQATEPFPVPKTDTRVHVPVVFQVVP